MLVAEQRFAKAPGLAPARVPNPAVKHRLGNYAVSRLSSVTSAMPWLFTWAPRKAVERVAVVEQ